MRPVVFVRTACRARRRASGRDVYKRQEKGRLLGAVGTTGYSTGPHLHYEVKIGRESVSPWPLFDGSSAIFAADAG